MVLALVAPHLGNSAASGHASPMQSLYKKELEVIREKHIQQWYSNLIGKQA